MDLETARKLAIENCLDGPDWALDPDTPIDQIRALIGSGGGCGPGATWGDWMVPDTMWGLNMKPVCYLHDCCYHDADNEARRHVCDLLLFTNGTTYIRAHSANWFMVWLRLKRLGKYFRMVNLGGGGFVD